VYWGIAGGWKTIVGQSFTLPLIIMPSRVLVLGINIHTGISTPEPHGLMAIAWPNSILVSVARNIEPHRTTYFYTCGTWVPPDVFTILLLTCVPT
jgi:hypothetical protein